MAGLGETCTHISSVLFYLEASARLYGTSKTCTDEACKWIIPSYQKEVQYLPIKNIDFTSARGKKRTLDGQIKAVDDDAVDSEDVEDVEAGESEQPKKIGSKPTESELALLFQNLSAGGTKPGVLSVVPKYSDEYVPKSSTKDFPPPLKALKDTKYMEMEYHNLLTECKLVSESIDITAESADSIEKATRDQSNSNLWFKYQAGRITASRMKAVCHTNAGKPAQSLIKGICYPEAFSFKSKATIWGCQHEQKARNFYFKTCNSQHESFSVKDSGLVINSEWPFIGASPDGIINCSCHGKGVLEIKCPFCHQESTIQSAAMDKKFCLKQSGEKLCLDEKHAYYYQIQTQLFVCDVEYADFCVCTFLKDKNNEYDDEGIHIERITKNLNFWKECVEKAHHFFTTCLLREILGNWYTRSIFKKQSSNCLTDDTTPGPSGSGVGSAGDNTSATQEHQTFCYCHGPEEGDMVACDNSKCTIEWFHITCLQMERLPKGKAKWYCLDCRLLPQFQVRKRKTRQ